MLTKQIRIIPAGRRNRPVTFPSSSRFNKLITPRMITVHNDNSTASNLSSYILTDACANRPASWHDSVDDRHWYQHLPYNESGWHAGDNMGPGNLTTLGLEICYGAGVNYEMAEIHGAWVAAQHIKTIPSLLPFPQCLVQHNRWSGKNCPLKIRAKAGGWDLFVNKVGAFLEDKPAPDMYVEESIGKLKVVRVDIDKIIALLEQR